MLYLLATFLPVLALYPSLTRYRPFRCSPCSFSVYWLARASGFSAQKVLLAAIVTKRSEVWFKLILELGRYFALFINNNKYYFPLKSLGISRRHVISLPPYCHDASHNNIDLAGRFRADDTQPPFRNIFFDHRIRHRRHAAPPVMPDVYLQSCSPLSAAVCPAAVRQHRAPRAVSATAIPRYFTRVTSDNGSGS